jgi:predicted aldo/keto reductase-like oxidoreductase
MKINDLEPRPLINLGDNKSLDLKVPELDLSHYRKLGRTDLSVSCLGLGGGGGISNEDAMYAFDRGINYFFYSSDLHHFIYSSMAGTLQDLCKRGSSVRDRVVLATVTYIKSPEVALAAILDQFLELGIDYIDVLFWGWIGNSDAAAFGDCLNLSNDLRGPNTVYQRTIEKMMGASDRLKKMGAVRYIGASFHDLNLAHQWLDSSLLDVVMVRHNVAHRSAQSQVFNCLDAQNPDRPGISTFKSAGSHSGALWDAPVGLPKGCWIPSVPDLYRYSLSQNCVDICLTGMRSPAEIDAAMSGIQQGKLTQSELDYLGIYGDLHRGRLRIQDIPAEQLIYRS